jgi:hypothetical protein
MQVLYPTQLVQIQLHWITRAGLVSMAYVTINREFVDKLRAELILHNVSDKMTDDWKELGIITSESHFSGCGVRPPCKHGRYPQLPGLWMDLQDVFQ